MEFYAHQKQVIDEKDRPDRLKFGNWRGTGSGKTKGTVAIAEGITLVVCPKQQFEEQIWPIEWKEQGRDPAELWNVSKEKFKAFIKEGKYLEVCGGVFPTTFIIDEAHTVAGVRAEMRQKNYVKYVDASDFHLAVMRYIEVAQPKRIHPLTATPAANPLSLWAFGQMLGRQWDFKQFREAFYYEAEVRGRTRWLPKFRRKAWPGSKPAIKEWIEREKKESIALAAKTKEAIGYVGTLSDWFDVPEQIFKTHVVGTTAAQEEKYKSLKTLYPDPLVQIGKIQKLEQGLFDRMELQPDGTVKEWIERIAENKTEAIERYLLEFGRVVVFCRYTEQIEMYRDHFESLGEKVFVLNGKTKNRKALLDEAKVSTEGVFIAQSSISSGWELPDWPCMIFASLDYSYTNYDQGVGRILRAKKLKKNLYIFLIAGKGDALVKEVISEKKEFSEARYAQILCKNTKLQ